MTEEELKHKILFVKCDTKEMLSDWVKLFIGLEMPDCIVDPNSNATPMDLLWEFYQKALDGKDPNYTDVLLYSARDGYKTVTCAILALLSLFHFRRNICLLAAVESQARRSASYLEKHLKRPILRDYQSSKNKRIIEVTWYEDDVGNTFSPVQYSAMTPGQQAPLKELKYSSEILVATMSGVNSAHVPLLILDELDLAPPEPVEESKFIPVVGEHGELPITFSTSSRKFAFGNVQKMIDNAPEAGTVIRHWSILDVTKRCPEERHRPDLPKLPIYHSEVSLKSYSKEEYQKLPPDVKKHCVESEGYWGCLNSCKLFAACQTRLATKQTSTSSLLKPIDHVQAIFRKVSPEKVKAQYLCWRPSSEGMIYPNLSYDLHMVTPAKIASMIIGDSGGVETKEDLIKLLLSRDIQFFSGMDWGSTHATAIVLGAVDGANCFIFDALEIPELELSDILDICETRIKPFNPIIYPDTNYPAYIKTLRRHGYRMREWNKGKGSVVDGIEVVRMKLMSPTKEPQLYFLKDDPGCELLFKRLASYHWLLDSAGRPTDQPDKFEDDLADAARYMIMNVFAPNGKVILAPKDPPKESQVVQYPTQVPGQPNTYNPTSAWQQMAREAGVTLNQGDGDGMILRSDKGGGKGLLWSFGEDD